MLNIVMFGAPGSGKGTQSAKLIDEYGLYHISTGDVLRREIAKGTELGKLAASYIDKGNLIPDDVIIDVLDNELKQLDESKNGVIFDGFPRTLKQAEALEDLLKKHDTELHAVIGLDVPEEELTKRILERGKISGRSDDNAESVKNRLQVYHDQTFPLREFYTQKGKFMPVNGHRIVDEIFDDIANGIEQRTGVARRKKK